MRVLFSILFLIIFQLSANAFSDGYHLSKVNGKTAITHMVEKGQTLYFISKKYNTSVNQIQQDNPHVNSSAIKEGQPIVIYFDKSLLTNVDMVDRSMCRPLIHTVQKGETLYGIAKREYDLDVSQVKGWNNMYNNELKIGQDLIVGWVYSDTSASAVYDDSSNGSNTTYTQPTSDPYSTTNVYTSETYTSPTETIYSNDNVTVTEYTGEYTSGGTTSSTYNNTGTTYTTPESNTATYSSPTTTYTSPTTSSYTNTGSTTTTTTYTSPSTNSNPDYLKSDSEIFIKSDSQNAIFSNPVSNSNPSRPGANVDLSDKPVYIGTVNSKRPGVVTMNSPNTNTTQTVTETTTAMVSTPPVTTSVVKPATSVDHVNTVSKKLARTIFFEQQMDRNGAYSLKNEKGAASWFEQENKGTELFAMHKTAPIGTVLKITNPVSKYTVYAKVVGQLPETGENSKSLLKLSSTAVELLKAYDKMFMVECEYYLAN